MAKGRGKKEKEPKLPPGISNEFIDRVNTLSPEARKALIVELQKNIDDSRIFLATNETIVQLKENLKECTASATETIKHMGNRTKYLIDELKKQGSL